MQCPNCQQEHPPSAKFCSECGSPLSLRCRSCGTDNLPGAKFCNECGAPLTGQSPVAHPSQGLDTPEQQTTPGTSSAARRDVPDAERRAMTVMFCDLVGSTPLSEQLDPEEFREVVRAYQEVCAEVIGRFEGYLAKYLGDGLLVYFGYPQAHDDDPQRAVHAGLGLMDAIARLNPRLEQEHGVRLAVRVGVHTGLVVAGEMGSGDTREALAIVGDTPNIAARLQEGAAPNAVVISTATYRLVAGYFACRDLGAQSLKGISQPVAAYQVRHASTARSRLDVAMRRGLTPLVGREQEVQLLLDCWEQARQGQGQLVVVSGEAGIGKSRLLLEFQRTIADAGTTWLEGHCSASGQHSAYLPIIDVLKRAFEPGFPRYA